VSGIERVRAWDRQVEGGGSKVQESFEEKGSVKPWKEWLAEKSARADGGGGNVVTDGLRQIGQLDQQANRLVIDLATGRDVNIHNTMIAMEKTEIALKMAVQFRNRALQAYEELMRVQV
jgi:flagellar hook-basal body complex protein FliE